MSENRIFEELGMTRMNDVDLFTLFHQHGRQFSDIQDHIEASMAINRRVQQMQRETPPNE